MTSFTAAGDFASYLVHRPQQAQFTVEAIKRYESIDKTLDAAPIFYFNAVIKIKVLAEQGDSRAMFHVGKIYSIGIAEKQNFNSAVH